MELNSKNYYNIKDRLNYSTLSLYYNNRLDKPLENISAFDFGKYFEHLIKYSCNIQTEDNFYILEKEFNLRRKSDKEELLELKENNPDKVFIHKEEQIKAINMVNNVLEMGFNGVKLRSYIEESVCDKAIYWEKDGIKKKALLDMVYLLDNKVFPFDFKTTKSDINYFASAIRNYNYWIQDIHYCEALEHEYPYHEIMPMTFVVSSKLEPYYSKCWQIDEYSRDEAIKQYKDLCLKYYINKDYKFVKCSNDVGFAKVYF